MENKDFFGKNFEGHTLEESAKKCQERCQRTDGCGAFSYVKDNYNGRYGKGIRQRCLLKEMGTVPDLVEEENIVSGPKHCPSK